MNGPLHPIPAAWRESDDNHGAARAKMVNRTHRVVRDQAERMREQRHQQRSLWVPLAICSSLLMVICYAVWGLLAGYDLTPTNIPDASDQMMLYLLLWSLPAGAVALSLCWFRRGGPAERTGGPTA